MTRNSSAYSINVTFKQIVIFLFAVVVISFVTFILGYRAGKSAAGKQEGRELRTTSRGEKVRELNFKDTLGERTDQAEDPLIEPDQPVESQPNRQEVESEIPTTAGAEPSRSDSPGAGDIYYYIQVGAFSQIENAEKYSRKFREQGYISRISPVTVGERTLYRVEVGQFSEKAEAERVRRKLERQEGKKFPLKLSR